MDKKFKAWWAAHKPTQRRLIQFYAALLYNANLKGFIKGEIFTGASKNVCVPGFNCYSCPGAIGACPLGALQNALASTGNRAPYYVLGILMLYGLTLGRTICGWLCPLGLIQELFYKIPTPKIRKNRVTKVLSGLKYVLLIVFVAAIPLWYAAQYFAIPAFCKYICPAGTLEGAMGLMSAPVNAGMLAILNILFTRKFIIMVIIFTACIFLYRAFCRFLCPLGALYGLFSRISLVGIKVDAGKCTHCGKCQAHCRVDIGRVGDHECIQCGECIPVCATKAITLKCGKITLMKNDLPDASDDQAYAQAQKTRRTKAIIAWGMALLALGFVLWFVNKPEPAQFVPIKTETVTQTPEVEVTAAEDPEPETSTPAPTPSVPVGQDVGNRCPDFSVPLYGPEGGNFSPKLGRVTVINFWATWCTPCVAELPNFQKLYDNYRDLIDIVAIHGDLVTDSVEAFIEREGYTMPFALDADSKNPLIGILGKKGMFPLTLILDQQGVIVFKSPKAVSYEALEEQVKSLLN